MKGSCGLGSVHGEAWRRSSDSARQLLRRMFMVSGLAAAAPAISPFFASLTPSARSFAERPRVEIPTLANGSFAFVADPRSDEQWPSELMFVRNPDGTLRVWWIPISIGRVSMPDMHWWRPLIRCRDFGPDFVRGEYLCRDTEAPEWIRRKARWTLAGKSLLQHPVHFDDMPRVIGQVEGRYFRIDRIDWGD